MMFLFKEVDNIYTQHKPLLWNILEQLSKGKLRTGQFPYHDQPSPKDRLVFIIIRLRYCIFMCPYTYQPYTLHYHSTFYDNAKFIESASFCFSSVLQNFSHLMFLLKILHHHL